MSKTLKAIAILLVITAVVITAGCTDNDPPTNNTINDPPTTETTPVITPVVFTSSDPQLDISPENKFPVVNPGQRCDDKVTISSTHGDAYNITLDAHSTDKHLAVYVDGKEGGPFESNEILKGNGQSLNVSIQTSPQITVGDYTILLKSTYYDIDKHVYTYSNNIIVTVKDNSWWGLNAILTDKIKSIRNMLPVI